MLASAHSLIRGWSRSFLGARFNRPRTSDARYAGVVVDNHEHLSQLSEDVSKLSDPDESVALLIEHLETPDEFLCVIARGPVREE